MLAQAYGAILALANISKRREDACSCQGLHHVTMITADAPRNVDFYAGIARPAAGQEDGQLRPAERLPPLLRRRARDAGIDPDLVRVRRTRRRGAPARGHDPHDRARRRARPTRSTSGSGASATRASRASARTQSLRFEDPEGLRFALVPAGRRQPAAARRASRDPGRACDHRGRGRARLRRRAATRRRAADRVLGFADLGDRRLPPRRRPAQRPLGLRRRAGGARPSGRRLGAPHRLGVARRGPPRLAARDRRPPGSPVTDVRDRDYFRSIYFPDAARRAVRDRDARAPGSRSTRIPSTSASSCACRRCTRTCASGSSGR